jgi:hypothetical protein
LVRAKGASRLKGLSIIANSIVIIATIAKDNVTTFQVDIRFTFGRTDTWYGEVFTDNLTLISA